MRRRVIIYLFQGNKEKNKNMCCREGGKKGRCVMEKKINATEKFCTKCGKKFLAVGREVICPACKEQAAEDAKRAAVMRAKRASWMGESVPVRISGRASTVIRAYGAEKSLPFAAALDELLKQSDCFKGMQMAWEDITPYKSRRRDKHATESATETESTSTTETPQEAQAAKQEVKQDAPQAAQAAKTSVKTAAKKAAGASKQAAGKTGKKA